jgi:hypothetical protein
MEENSIQFRLKINQKKDSSSEIIFCHYELFDPYEIARYQLIMIANMLFCLLFFWSVKALCLYCMILYMGHV